MTPECKPHKYERVSVKEEWDIDRMILWTKSVLRLRKDGTGILAGRVHLTVTCQPARMRLFYLVRNPWCACAVFSPSEDKFRSVSVRINPTVDSNEQCWKWMTNLSNWWDDERRTGDVVQPINYAHDSYIIIYSINALITEHEHREHLCLVFKCFHENEIFIITSEWTVSAHLLNSFGI